MLSPGYFGYRWSWYAPILDKGEQPANRCRVDVRRLPVRMHGQDAREYIPYAIDSAQMQALNGAIRRLHDYANRYMLQGEKVSAHKLPQLNSVSRDLMMHLRKRYPHLPQTLLHHWCADEHGGLAFLQLLQNLWVKSWRQDQLDVAPWVPAVNVLILKMIREAIRRLPPENAEHTDHVMVCVAGGLYDWAMRNFLRQHVDGAVEMTRIATYESMMIPATPISFLYRQTDNAMLGDDRFVVMAYGLEPELIPRMRALREKLGPKNEAGILGLLPRERMGEHFLRRSWVRLALWELAEQTGQGVWMQWVLDPKKLDQLISRPELLPQPAIKLLEASAGHPLAAWLLARLGKGKPDETPWLHDDRVLTAFRVFEEDVHVEVARRKLEPLWLDQRDMFKQFMRGDPAKAEKKLEIVLPEDELAHARKASGSGNEAEIDKRLDAIYQEGRLVFFLSDPGKPMHMAGERKGLGNQASLSIDWSAFVMGLAELNEDRSDDLLKSYIASTLAVLKGRNQVFLDDFSAAGAVLRGPARNLLAAGQALQQQVRDWKKSNFPEMDVGLPDIPMCISTAANWHFGKHADQTWGELRWAVSSAVAQARAGVSHDEGIAAIMAMRDQSHGAKPLGKVRIEPIGSKTGKTVELLCNHGLAVTGPAVLEIANDARKRGKVLEFQVARQSALAVLDGYQVGEQGLEFTILRPNDAEQAAVVMIKVGRPNLAGNDVDLYEVMDAESPVTRLILSDGISRWRA